MAITFSCKECDEEIRVKDSYAGKKGKCPHCKAVVRIPGGSREERPKARPKARSRDRDRGGGGGGGGGGGRSRNRARGRRGRGGDGDDPEQADRAFDKLKKVAELAGYNIDYHPSGTMMAAGFELGGGRRQMVFMSYMGETPDGKDIISFMSPALEMKKGFLSGISKKQALDLLQRNPKIPFGSFGIHTMDGVDLIMVTSNQIVDTMEVEEFEAHIQCVALVADEYEREHGQDVF